MIIKLKSIVALLCAVLTFVIATGCSTSSGDTAAEPSSQAAVSVSVVPPKGDGGIVPNRILIPDIGVNAVVEPKGTVDEYAPFLDQMVPSFGVPDDIADTTWWSDGPKPGSTGMAIILGHTQVGGGEAVFDDISLLREGQRFSLTSESGETVEFAVTRVVQNISKSDPEALNKTLSEAPSVSALALVTCGGEFDSKRDASAENIVVFADGV
ncbi:class F sortase [Rhodococcus erythropolis]|uniref:class F sortase n=1 Tax=Rhodococcus erythropolis TaxID=1833 RepID=UPI0008CDBD2D|nr:class F sortase [Rhodococcus erythropolis]OFV78605.1 sortase family protein [Rhodococcus erythropolis]